MDLLNNNTQSFEQIVALAEQAKKLGKRLAFEVQVEDGKFAACMPRFDTADEILTYARLWLIMTGQGKEWRAAIPDWEFSPC